MIISLISSIIAFLLMFLLIIFSDTCIPETKNALLHFMNTILPTMFPFYVLSSFVVSSKYISVLTKPLAKFTKIFHLPSESFCAILLGLCCGFPIGAKITCDLFKNNLITKKQAAILSSFTNNISPIYASVIIGSNCFSNKKTGIMLWLCLTISSLIAGYIMSRIFLKKNDTISTDCNIYQDTNIDITQAITSGLNTTLYVGAVIIFFSSITAVLKKLPLISNRLYIIIYPILEITGGINIISNYIINDSYIFKCIILLIISSWSGICIHLQIYGLLKSYGIKFKYYYLCKIFQLIISILILLLIYLIK